MPADAESICTRVVARVIEELSCVDIAPDSPHWTSLERAGTKVGTLAQYRGRSGVERLLSFDVHDAENELEVHYVAVLTDARSFVPHLLVRTHGNGSDVQVHVDLLPRAPLEACPAYVRCCYAPLGPLREQALRNPPVREGTVSTRYREWGSAEAFSCAAQHGELDGAARCVDAYTNHWARLMRQGTPFEAQRDAEAALAETDWYAQQRDAVFARDADAFWTPLEAVIGTPSVDMLLAALRDDI